MFQEASRAADESASSGAATTAYANAPAEPLPEAKRIISKEANAVDDACPPTSAKLGRSTWTLLHTMAAWYPDEPSKAEQTSMKRFFSALGRFYPCPWCATDFRANLEEKPPQYVPTLVFTLVSQLSSSISRSILYSLWQDWFSQATVPVAVRATQYCESKTWKAKFPL
jgi:hypothetical protein